ncbi:unnamed protein product [Ceratitis capitata]|uniref:(Mediterranean fruit fly) hypothetical protein n=1 Tax=Ceratitis capitata TaxID=7213 RepID=A0A811VHT4_CERCA|nr:unnamed protein product [Ceratitis capitata]
MQKGEKTEIGQKRGSKRDWCAQHMNNQKKKPKNMLKMKLQESTKQQPNLLWHAKCDTYWQFKLTCCSYLEIYACLLNVFLRKKVATQQQQQRQHAQTLSHQHLCRIISIIRYGIPQMA